MNKKNNKRVNFLVNYEVLKTLVYQKICSEKNGLMELSEEIKEQLEKNRLLIMPHQLTNFQILKYYQNEQRFNVV